MHMHRITGIVASLFVFASLCVAQEARVPSNIAVGINHRTPDNMLYSNANIGFFANVDTLRGAQLALFTGVVRNEMCGVNIGVLSAVSHGRAYGVQIAGFVNAGSGEMRGVQMASVANVARSFNGVQIGGLTNACTSPMRGMQIAGITNIAMGVKRGWQMAAVANVCSSYMRGLQTALHNYADTLNGSQIGVLNVCISHPRGVQIGVINYSRDTIAHKIGLVNVNPLTRIDMMVYGGSSTKFNVAARFRNRSTYSMIGFGTHYMGLDEKFSGALFYRIGQYFMLTPRLSVSGDVGYYHVETFEEHKAGKPSRLYSLQARVNIDYQIGKTLGAFVSGGYGDTRYYHHARKYRDRAIIEAGLTLRYHR